MSALDDLLGEFTANAGTMPRVNPPEAAQVLATQTAPEVAGAPEPAPADEAPPAPTEKPAEVKAAEQARTRKPRGGAKATSPAEHALQAAPASASPDRAAALDAIERADLLTTEAMVRELRHRGYAVTLVAG